MLSYLQLPKRQYKYLEYLGRSIWGAAQRLAVRYVHPQPPVSVKEPYIGTQPVHGIAWPESARIPFRGLLGHSEEVSYN